MKPIYYVRDYKKKIEKRCVTNLIFLQVRLIQWKQILIILFNLALKCKKLITKKRNHIFVVYIIKK